MSIFLRPLRLRLKAECGAHSTLVAFVLAIASGSFVIALMILSVHLPAADAQGPVTYVSIVPGASTLADKAFLPNVVNVRIGDTVRWTNNDALFHTVISGITISDANKGKEFDSGLSGSTALTTNGKTFDHPFTQAGQFPYFCQLHPTMIGKVIVSST